MKIVFFLDKEFDVAPDIATWVELVKNIKKKNEVIIYARKRGFVNCHEENFGLDIRYLPSHSKPILNRLVFYTNQLIKYRKIVSIENPDVIIFNTLNPVMLKLAIKFKREKQLNQKLIYDVRTLVVSKDILASAEKVLFSKCLKTADKYFDGITFITKEMENYCRKKFLLRINQSALWSSGVNIQLFKPDKVTDIKLNKEFRLLYHGSIAKNRGIQNIVRALPMVNKNIKLILLGSGQGLDDVIGVVRKYSLENQVCFCNQIHYLEVPKVINTCDAGIVPLPNWIGWNTSSPLKLFEYLSCGKPVIVTDIPAHKKVLPQENFVFWAGNGTPEEIATAITDAYNNKSKFGAFAQQARKFICDNYTWQKQAEKLEEFIKEVCSRTADGL